MVFLASNSLHNLRGQKWSCPYYHARHLLQIHWIFCEGFMVSQPNRLFQHSTTMSLINKIPREPKMCLTAITTYKKWRRQFGRCASEGKFVYWNRTNETNSLLRYYDARCSCSVHTSEFEQRIVQVNFFQKHLFLHQLSHNMNRECKLNSP